MVLPNDLEAVNLIATVFVEFGTDTRAGEIGLVVGSVGAENTTVRGDLESGAREVEEGETDKGDIKAEVFEELDKLGVEFVVFRGGCELNDNACCDYDTADGSHDGLPVVFYELCYFVHGVCLLVRVAKVLFDLVENFGVAFEGVGDAGVSNGHAFEKVFAGFLTLDFSVFCTIHTAGKPDDGNGHYDDCAERSDDVFHPGGCFSYG